MSLAEVSPTQTQALQVACIRDTAGLRALVRDWEHLFARTPDATPFQHPAWLMPWWEAFSPGDLRVLAVHAGARLVALAPLYRESGEQASKLLPLGISLSDYGGLLVAPDVPGEALAVLSEAIGALDAHRLDWPDLPAFSLALALPAPTGWRREEGAAETCPVLDVVDWCASVPALRRRKLRMALHRAERAGGARLVPLAETGCGSFLDALEELHGARWEEKGEPGVLDDPCVRAFHRAALPGLLAAGLADAWLLMIGGRLAGAYYGLRRGRQAYAYLSGFDPSFSRESPGTILVGSAVERACAEGVHVYHFLRGREAYKYEWGAVDSWTRRLSLVRGDG